MTQSDPTSSSKDAPRSPRHIFFAVGGLMLAGTVAIGGQAALNRGGVSQHTAVWMVLSVAAAICGIVAILLAASDLSGPKGVVGGQDGKPELRGPAWTALGVGVVVSVVAIYFFKQFIEKAQV